MWRQFGIFKVWESIQQPSYTGENRCLPCTIINVFIALLISAGLGVISLWLSFGSLVLLLFTIYIRGYLVPYTPEITQRYVPEAVLEYFDNHHGATSVTENFDVETVLRSVDVVTECDNRNDLCLSDMFRSGWRSRIRAVNENDTSRSDLATILDISPAEIEIKEHGDAFVAMVNGRRIGQWESHPALIADIASGIELRQRITNWNRLSPRQQGSLMTGLRIFLEKCPSCSGPVSIDQEEVKSCCRTIDVVAATCEECGVRLFESEEVSA